MPIQSPIQPDPSTSAGIKARIENEKEYNKANPKDPLVPNLATPKPSTPVDNGPYKIDKVNYTPKPKGEKRIPAKDIKDWSKPLPQYGGGTSYVPSTGPAVLHKGEAVIPKDKNMADKKKSPYKMITEGGDKPAKAIKHIITRKSHDGKFIHTHVHHHPAHHPDEEHVSNDMGELHDHFEQHAGTPNVGEQPEQGGDQPAQMSAQAPPMPQAPPQAGPMPGMGA